MEHWNGKVCWPTVTYENLFPSVTHQHEIDTVVRLEVLEEPDHVGDVDGEEGGLGLLVDGGGLVQGLEDDQLPGGGVLG